MFLDILELRVENKKKWIGKTVLKICLRNLPEQLVLSPEYPKDFKHFHCFLFLFFLVFALLSKSSFVDTLAIFLSI